MTSTTPASTPVSPSAKGATSTSYVILTRHPGSAATSEMWRQAGAVTAKSADAAIRVHATKDPTNGLELVAIPSRSWQPRKVRVETSTKVTLG